MHEWIYLSHPLAPETPMYGGRQGLQLTIANAISQGQSANSLHLAFPNHLGTHLDVPRHFFDDGDCVDDYPAGFWHFEAPLCLDCPKQPGDLVVESDLARELDKVEPSSLAHVDCLLIKTGFEKLRGDSLYWENNPGIGPGVGFYLRENFPKVRCLGIDVISVSRWQDRETGRAAHRSLLDPQGKGRPIVIVEDMSFANLGLRRIHKLLVAPLVVANADGGPCTVMAQVR